VAPVRAPPFLVALNLLAHLLCGRVDDGIFCAAQLRVRHAALYRAASIDSVVRAQLLPALAQAGLVPTPIATPQGLLFKVRAEGAVAAAAVVGMELHGAGVARQPRRKTQCSRSKGPAL